MSKTHRDAARHFFGQHFAHPGGSHWDRPRGASCRVCGTEEARTWARPYRFEKGIPSGWKTEQRRVERAKSRDLVNRARSGNLDWDAVPVGAAKTYRRPYYL